MSVAHGLLFFRLTIVIVFAASVVGKLSSRRDFEIALDGFNLPGGRRSRRRAVICVIVLEIATAGFVGAGGPMLVPGLALAIGLLIAFSLVLGRALRQRLVVSCNCFGPGVRMISIFDVWRNAVLILCACAALVLHAQAQGQAPGLDDAALLVSMSAVLVLMISNLGDVVTTLRAPL